MLKMGLYQVSLKQQIRFNSKIFGNKQCCYNEGPLYVTSYTASALISFFISIIGLDKVCDYRKVS